MTLGLNINNPISVEIIVDTYVPAILLSQNEHKKHAIRWEMRMLQRSAFGTWPCHWNLTFYLLYLQLVGE
jgi:hypothetical protein